MLLGVYKIRISFGHKKHKPVIKRSFVGRSVFEFPSLQEKLNCFQNNVA